MARQALSHRIPDRETIEQRTDVWQKQRNTAYATVDWQFTTEEARVKPRRLYPKIDEALNRSKHGGENIRILSGRPVR